MVLSPGSWAQIFLGDGFSGLSHGATKTLVQYIEKGIIEVFDDLPGGKEEGTLLVDAPEVAPPKGKSLISGYWIFLLTLCICSRIGSAAGDARAGCGLSNGLPLLNLTGVTVPETAGIRLRVCSDNVIVNSTNFEATCTGSTISPSFDSKIQVQGRLEVKVGNDWATVAEWAGFKSGDGEAEATVACRQLGNELGYTLVSASKVGSRQFNGPTFDGSGTQYEVTCAGTESTVNSCTSFGVWGGSPNFHWYDVGVSCTFLAFGEECEECVAGKYSNTIGVEPCIDCVAGSYSNSGAASCTPCEAGTVSTTPGTATCTECHALATSSEDRTKCLCVPGSESVMLTPRGVVPDTMGIRLRTDEGTPSFDSEGQVQGRLEVKIGHDWVTFCDTVEGFDGSAEDEVTVACRQLGNELGYTLVSASKVGMDDTDDGSGTMYKVDCAGTESTLDSCKSFYPGCYDNHDYDVGVSCTFLAPSDDCEECVAGKYSKYSNTTNISACSNCAAGSYSSTAGATSCEMCEAGKVAPPAATACTECVSGQPSGDQTYCLCGPGSRNTHPGPISGLVVPITTGIRLQISSGLPLFDSKGKVQGRLEAKDFNGECPNNWNTIVDSYLYIIGSAEPTIACRQLGNELGFTLVSASKVERDDTDDGSGMAYKVTCAGTESTLDSCTTFEHSGYYDTNHEYDVGLSCTFLGPGAECEECAAGKYSNTIGVTTCTDCDVGSYSSAGATSCEKCVAGKASVTPAATNAAVCGDCPSGTYANIAIGATRCVGCAAGSYSNAGATSCEQCEAGKASGNFSASGAAACTECPFGKKSSKDRSKCACGLGSGTVMLKPSGVVSNTTGIRLQTNALGTPSFDSDGQVQGRLEVKIGDDWLTVAGISDSFGGSDSTGGEAESTVACRQLGNELGYTLVSASKVGKDDTDDGSGAQVATFTCFGMEVAITSCVSGPTYSDVAANHIYDVGVSCTFFAPSDDCEECVVGKYSNTTSNAVCMDCVAGLYSSTRGATSCEQCKAGKASANPAATSASDCDDCPSGTYANAAIGATRCIGCAAGSYSILVGSVSADDCQKCEAGKASAILAASSAAACTECVAGKFTGTTGTAECVVCPAGSFGTVVGSASADNCKQCEAGKASETPAASSATACTECPSSLRSSEDRSACGCTLGSGNILVVPSGILPNTTGVRLQTASGTPSFDSKGQVQGRLEVNVGDEWVTIKSDGPSSDSFGGSGSDGGEAESTVACRQLGNELGYTLVSSSKVYRMDTDNGSGNSYILICAGTESNLDSCPVFMPTGTDHAYDIGVSCTFLAPGDECEECLAGKFSNTTGVAACMDCKAGTYSTGINSMICQLCQPGKVSEYGSSSCTTCEELGTSVWHRGTGCAVTTSLVRAAVDGAVDGDVVDWEAGTGKLVQDFSDDWGWLIKMPITLQCTDMVAKCIIDAQANICESRSVLGIENVEGVFLTGLVIMGGYPDSIRVAKSIVTITSCEIRLLQSNIAEATSGHGSGDMKYSNIYIETDATVFKGCKKGEYGKLILETTGNFFDPSGSIGDYQSNFPGDNSQYSNCGYDQKKPCNYCTPCKPGTISLGAQTTCTLCPPGTHSNEARSACLPCPIGTASTGGEMSCDECSKPGEFSHVPGASVCTLALPGTEVSATNGVRLSSTPCPVGSYSTGFLDDCLPCEVGKYAASSGSQTCSFCSNAVKGSTTEHMGARTEGDCGCTVGFFKSTVTGDCEAVQEGVSKNVTSMNVTTLHLEPNYWRNSENSVDIRRCFSDSACLGGANPSSYCDEGHTGPYCGVCKPGFSGVGSSTSGMQCVRCGGDQTLTIALGVTLFALLLLLPLAYFNYKRRKNKQGDVEALESTADDVKRVLAKKKLLGKKVKAAQKFRQGVQTVSKILLSYVQIVSGFSFNFGIRFPDLFARVMSVFAFANLDFLSLTPIGCIFPTNYHRQLLVYTILPLLAFGALLGLYTRLKSRGTGSQAFREELFNAFLFLSFLVLPTTSTKILNTFACDQLDSINGKPGQWVLKSDMNIDCESTTHIAFQWYAVAMVFVYPIGIPLFYYVLLARAQGGLATVLHPRLQHLLPARLLGDESELLLDCGQDKLVNTKIVKLVVEEEEEEGVTEGQEEVTEKAKKTIVVANVCDYITSADKIEAAAESGLLILETTWIKTLGESHKPLLEFIAHQSNVSRVFWHVGNDNVIQLAVEVTLSEKGAMDEALRRREEMEGKHTRLSRLKFLYEAYEPQCWWFEVFETLRRLLLTGGQVLLRPNTPSQIVLNLIICICSIKIYATYKPFVSDKVDKLAELAQFQLFFTMLAALCIKVDISDEDNYNKATFDMCLAGMQFMGPVLLVYQGWIQGGTKGAAINAEVGGAMDDVRKLARSYSGAKEAAKSLEMTSLGKRISNKLRSISSGAIELAGGAMSSKVGRRQKEEKRKALEAIVPGCGDHGVEDDSVEIPLPLPGASPPNQRPIEKVTNPLQDTGKLAPHIERARVFSGARSPSKGLGNAGRGKGSRLRGSSSAPDNFYKNQHDDFSI
ncbi:hypothetical protein TrRE_jg8423 [Triparma retinervis]|uniref:SRCR domain-containing protein n=1 Tax=Triparma retinervis TaxID=2557542 RepID=A0A9W7DRQ9_9STRA|nr:hypothetical protein TrRE_jg8423 [Triparma retinervis]